MAGPVFSSRAAAPVGPYPHARAAGGLLFLSGIGPRRPGTGEIPDGFDAQARATFDNVGAVLADAGAAWADIVDVTVFLVHMARDFGTLNERWLDAFPDEATRPCRTTVEVTSLPTPIDIELKVIVAPGSSVAPGSTTAPEDRP